MSARWTGLAGRVLSTWPDRFEDQLGTSEADEAHAQLVFPLSQLPEQIEPLVGRIVAPLFQRFNPTPLATNELLSTQIRLLRERLAS